MATRTMQERDEARRRRGVRRTAWIAAAVAAAIFLLSIADMMKGT
ncbi:hypothetical protein [Frateuria defendens]|nr:hypothetical protein [Frateuria defendens]